MYAKYSHIIKTMLLTVFLHFIVGILLQSYSNDLNLCFYRLTLNLLG
jgi:hypothetical protein